MSSADDTCAGRCENVRTHRHHARQLAEAGGARAGLATLASHHAHHARELTKARGAGRAARVLSACCRGGRGEDEDEDEDGGELSRKTWPRNVWAEAADPWQCSPQWP